MPFENEGRTRGVPPVECGRATPPTDPQGPVAVHDIVREWMGSYLANAHEEMPRPGTVCPFVKPTLEAGLIEIRSVPDTGQDPLHAVVEEAQRGLEEFSALLACEGSRRAKGATVLVFPDLIGNGAVIDAAHERVKGRAVKGGLMIGQFHSECSEPSVRNADFAVNHSPIPLLAIRAMTVHDILFLHGRPEWFAAYVRMFGHLYAGGHRLDPAFRRFFEEASSRFGIGPGLTESRG